MSDLFPVLFSLVTRFLELIITACVVFGSYTNILVYSIQCDSLSWLCNFKYICIILIKIDNLKIRLKIVTIHTKAKFNHCYPQPDLTDQSIPQVYLPMFEILDFSYIPTKKSQWLRSGNGCDHGTDSLRLTYLFGKVLPKISWTFRLKWADSSSQIFTEKIGLLDCMGTESISSKQCLVLENIFYVKFLPPVCCCKSHL